ncbi:hypothetical protein J6590_005865 [Homalodisca vitripennis]|nr:hypothetical protein J6590_005865 [Homalodisca vitripennis]
MEVSSEDEDNTLPTVAHYISSLLIVTIEIEGNELTQYKVNSFSVWILPCHKRQPSIPGSAIERGNGEQLTKRHLCGESSGSGPRTPLCDRVFASHQTFSGEQQLAAAERWRHDAVKSNEKDNKFLTKSTNKISNRSSTILRAMDWGFQMDEQKTSQRGQGNRSLM